jgi:cytochrome c-type biogenesis protein CcmH
VLLSASSFWTAFADESDLDARARALTEDFRCLVCDGQSLSQSDAKLAQDMRNFIRERLAQGQSEEDIRAYLVKRYGENILLRPPLRTATYLLWFGPLIFFALLATVAGVHMLSLHRRNLPADPLTHDEENRLRKRVSGRSQEP